MARRKGRATTEVIGVAPVNFPTGCVLPYAGTTAPEGWLLCDGSTVSRTDFAGLFAVLGSTHGQGDGSTTFHIPDLRGRFVRGVDGAANRDPDKATRTAANAGGNTGNNVGSVQDDAVQGHFHQGYQGNGNTGNSPSYGSISNQPFTVNPTYPNSPVTDGSNGAPRTSSESRGKNVNLNHIIKI
jgi:hypothetical protein